MQTIRPLDDSNDMHLSVDIFTYPNWQTDKDSVEKILCNSPSSFAETYARRKLKSMENKQHMHQGTIQHPGKSIEAASWYSARAIDPI